jgi:hypothetical protein
MVARIIIRLLKILQPTMDHVKDILEYSSLAKSLFTAGVPNLFFNAYH